MDNFYYLTYDLPVPYKKLKIYPVKVIDYIFFNYYSQCFLLDKNSTPDLKIITMSNLEYIFYKTQEDMEKTPYLLWFDRVLSYSLKDENFEKLDESISRYKYDEKGKPYFEIGGEKYDSRDYDEIKKIICAQNMIDLPDESISKEVRDSLEKAKEYKNKISGTKSASFEDMMISLSTVTGWTLEYIYTMSIRKFVKSIRRMDNYVHYKIYLAASMSGMVEFKDKSFIKHWLTNIDEDDNYKDVALDFEEMQGKISMESAKK